KACIAKRTKRFDFPPNSRTIQQIYTHDLRLLVKSAGLELELKKALDKDKNLEINWAIVVNWDEEGRYLRGLTRKKVQDFRSAIVSRKHGVLTWIKSRW